MIQGFGTFARDGVTHLGFRAGDLVVDLGEGSLDELLSQGRAAWERATEQAVAAADAGDAIPLEQVDAAAAVHGRRLRRLLLLARARDEPRPDVPARLRAAAAELAPPAGRLPRPGRDGRRQRHAGPAAAGAGQVAGRRRPAYGPSRRLDIELELGFVVGTPSRLGEPVPAGAFADHVFGVVLVNDWSARDIQAWEYVPLGPFLGKSFATSISAWVTPLALLDDRRVTAPPQDPEPLRHLQVDGDWALDIPLEVELNGQPISRGNARTLYWTMPQQLAHVTSNGANVRTGDLMASGTISGTERGSEGSLIELTWNGAEPLRLADGSERTFLEDGDEVVLRGEPLGEVRGRIVG